MIKKALAILLLTGLSLTAFHIHPVIDTDNHQTCAVCHSQGNILTASADLPILTSFSIVEIVKLSEITHDLEIAVTNAFPRAPPAFS